jgi:hypothetical protein
MFKATHKRRATTLSKTLLTAGLLGGAALSTLGAGSAQAAWTPDPGLSPSSNSYSCTFGGIVPCALNDPTGIVGLLPEGDKILTILNYNSIANGSNLKFEYQPPDIHPFHVDLDLAGNDLDGGLFGYTLQVSGSSDKILSAYLAAQAPAGIVTKDIYSSAALYNGGTGGAGDLCQLTTLGTQCDFSGVSQVWVRDTWAPTGAGVDNLSNDFAQKVPAPLPLLGAGAAFGSIRKLRKFSSQLKTFSMG